MKPKAMATWSKEVTAACERLHKYMMCRDPHCTAAAAPHNTYVLDLRRAAQFNERIGGEMYATCANVFMSVCALCAVIWLLKLFVL